MLSNTVAQNQFLSTTNQSLFTMATAKPVIGSTSAASNLNRTRANINAAAFSGKRVNPYMVQQGPNRQRFAVPAGADSIVCRASANDYSMSAASSGNQKDLATTKILSQQHQATNAKNSYLDSLNSKNVEMENYEKFNQVQMNTNVTAMNQTPIQEAANQAIAGAPLQSAAVVEEVQEVSYKVEKMEEKPIVITNHFEGDVTKTQQTSITTGAATRSYGTLLSNFFHSFMNVDGKMKAGPGFAMVFAALCFVVPTPAFAATAAKTVAAGASVAATSNMTKLLKSVACAGLAAVITVSFIHPIDVTKTRMQVAKAGEGSLGQVIGGALKTEGPGAFYKGIGPAWLREASYTSLRLGLYEPIKVLVGATASAGFFRKFLAGAIAGAVGSCAGNPFDVLKTRMMADKEGNRGLGSYASEIMKNDGFGGFYKGFNVNVLRAMVLNATKMACYDTCKAFIITTFAVEGLLLQFMAAFTAGLFMTITVAPFDMCRTLLMNQKKNEDGTQQYNSLGDCFMQILKEGGPMGFYKGFIPIWTRFAPTTCLQLIIFEQLKRVPFFAI